MYNRSQSVPKMKIPVSIGMVLLVSGLAIEAGAASDLTPTLKSLAVSPGAGTVPAGKTLQYSATATYSDGSTKNVTDLATWSSSFPMTAKVSETGIASAVSSGVTMISAKFLGDTASVPCLVPIPTTGIPDVTLYGNPTDSRLVSEKLSDGSIVEYFGAKDAKGLATSISTIVINRTNGNSATAAFDGEGRPTLFHGSLGGSIVVNWTSTNEGTVAAISPDGKLTVGPVRFGVPAIEPDSLHSQFGPFDGLLRQIRSAERASISRGISTTLPVTTVEVSRCNGRPVKDATVLLKVETKDQPVQILPSSGQNVAGFYDFYLAVPDPTPGLTAGQICNDFETAATQICKAGGRISKIVSVIGGAIATLTAVIVPELLIVDILATEFQGIVQPTCDVLFAPIPGQPGKTSFDEGCKLVDSLENDTNPNPKTLTPYAYLHERSLEPFTAPPHVVPGDDPSANFEINAEDTGDCGTASVAVSPDPVILPVDSSLALSAQAFDGDFNPVSDSFSWNSSKPAIAKVVSATGEVKGVQSGSTAIMAKAANGVTGQVRVTVGQSSFWGGSYQITECNTPGLDATYGNGACDLVMAWPNGAGNPGGWIEFRTDDAETYNFRRDYTTGGYPEQVCKADSIAIMPGTAQFIESTWGFFTITAASGYDPATVTYQIASWTKDAISGTFTAPVPYQITSGGEIMTGGLKGTWQATPLPAPFAKCVPPSSSNLYCQDVNGGEDSSPNGKLIPCAKPFLPLGSPARPGEWEGFPADAPGQGEFLQESHAKGAGFAVSGLSVEPQ